MSLDRSTLRGVHVGDRVWLDLADGNLMQYRYDQSKSAVSSQSELIARLPSVFGPSSRAKEAEKSDTRTRTLGLIIGIVVAIAYVIWHLYRRQH
jgi:hypothetical protein